MCNVSARIRNESADGSRFCQPGRERPRWLRARARMCATPVVANNNAPEDDNRPDATGGFCFRPWCAIANSQRPSRIMSSAFNLPTALRIRVSAENPNHHLWNNHGTWFLHYTVHPTPFTKERVRRSLGTASLDAARERRDAFFAHLHTESQPDPMQAVA